MRNLVIGVSLLICPSLIGQGLTSSPFSIVKGTLTGLNNAPVAGAYVTAVRVGSPPASQTSKSAADGSFQIEPLPAGTYQICVQAPGTAYLDPCRWDPPSAMAGLGGATLVTVSSGQTLANQSIKLSQGSIIQVQVNDPGNLMAQKTKDGYPPDLLMGVRGPQGLFHPVFLTAKTAGNAVYLLTVPLDTALTFSIQSQHLKIANSSGAALAAGVDQQVFQQKSGAASSTSFTYSITGFIP